MRGVADDVLTLSNLLVTVGGDDEEAPKEEARSNTAANATAKPGRAAEAREEEGARVEGAMLDAIDEVGASIAWLEEEKARLEEERSHLGREAAAEEAACAQLSAQGAAARKHVLALHRRIDSHGKATTAAHSRLRASHVLTAQQVQQCLASVDQTLRADRAVDGPTRDHLMGELKQVADLWLREAAEMATRLQLTPTDQREAEERPGNETGDAVSAALQAAAASRGALVERANAAQLELASLKMRITHVEEVGRRWGGQGQREREGQCVGQGGGQCVGRGGGRGVGWG